jgi:divalent metal cation (Fe/Co/Zn/Cd) transporter
MSDSLSNYVRKRKIANKSTWTSVVVNFFLVIFQIVVGFFSKSSGLDSRWFSYLS